MNKQKKIPLKFLVASAAFVSLLSLTACGDDSSSGAPMDEPSSSATEVLPDDLTESSSSVASSSSEEKTSSSSIASSSSVVPESSSDVVEEPVEQPEEPKNFTDERDGQTYKTVKIGDQVWMAENLNFNSNFLPEGAADSVYNSFCFGDDDAACEKSGRLYLWSAAMDSAGIYSDDAVGCGYYEECEAKEVVRGICPKGWHFPNNAEWKVLFEAAGGENYAARELKATTGWSQNGKDTYGFAVIPSGRRNAYGSYEDENVAHYWVPDQLDKSSAYVWDFTYSMFMMDDHFFEDNAFAVRCVRNAE